MKRATIVLAGLLAAFTLGACTPGAAATGELRVAAPSKAAFAAAQAMDGDAATGWVCSKKASTANFQKLDIDFGEPRTFNTVTLDDSFSGGFTNLPPEYLGVTASYRTGNVTSLADGSSPASCVSGAADGAGWQSAGVPDADAPEMLWISLRESVTAVRLVLDNAMFNSAMRSFALYVSPTALPRASALDPGNEAYTLAAERTDNTDNVVEIALSAPTPIRDVLLVVREQRNEGRPVAASLDELFFYGAVPDDYTEAHYPVQFVLMAGNNGKNYDVIFTETANYRPVWTATLETAVTYRYVRYLVYEELNRNYPSMGEFRFETL